MKHQLVPVISRSSRMISRKMVRWITFLALAVLIMSVDIWWQAKKRPMEQVQFVVAPN